MWARFVLEGRISKPRPSSPCDVANTTYIVVGASGITEPVRVKKASDYRALLGDFTGSSSLSHGFAPKAEAKVYCLGLNIPYFEKVCINGARCCSASGRRECGALPGVLAPGSEFMQARPG